MSQNKSVEAEKEIARINWISKKEAPVTPNPFEVLDISAAGCSAGTVRGAFVRLSKLVHPDKVLNKTLKVVAEDAFGTLCEAHDALKEPKDLIRLSAENANEHNNLRKYLIDHHVKSEFIDKLKMEGYTNATDLTDDDVDTIFSPNPNPQVGIRMLKFCLATLRKIEQEEAKVQNKKEETRKKVLALEDAVTNHISESGLVKAGLMREKVPSKVDPNKVLKNGDVDNDRDENNEMIDKEDKEDKEEMTEETYTQEHIDAMCMAVNEQIAYSAKIQPDIPNTSAGESTPSDLATGGEPATWTQLDISSWIAADVIQLLWRNRLHYCRFIDNKGKRDQMEGASFAAIDYLDKPWTDALSLPAETYSLDTVAFKDSRLQSTFASSSTSLSVEASGSGWGVSFGASLNAAKSSTEEEIDMNMSYSTVSRVRARAVRIDLRGRMKVKPEVETLFMNGLKKYYTKRVVIELLLQKYGGYVVVDATFGVQATGTHTGTSSSNVKATELASNVTASMHASGYGQSGSVSVSIDKSEKGTSEQNNSFGNMTISVKGSSVAPTTPQNLYTIAKSAGDRKNLAVIEILAVKPIFDYFRQPDFLEMLMGPSIVPATNSYHINKEHSSASGTPRPGEYHVNFYKNARVGPTQNAYVEFPTAVLDDFVIDRKVMLRIYRSYPEIYQRGSSAEMFEGVNFRVGVTEPIASKFVHDDSIGDKFPQLLTTLVMPDIPIEKGMYEVDVTPLFNELKNDKNKFETLQKKGSLSFQISLDGSLAAEFVNVISQHGAKVYEITAPEKAPELFIAAPPNP